MRTRIIILLLFITSLVYAEKIVLRIPNLQKSEISNLINENIDVAAVHPDFVDIVIDVKNLHRYKAKYANSFITQTESKIKENLSSGSKVIPGYHSYEEILELLQNYAANYPEICQLTDIGDTWGKEYSMTIPFYEDYNHEVWALKLSDNVNEDEDEPEYYFMGAHHSREPISTEVTMAILEDLISNYNIETEATDIINNKEVWFIPIVNPNGQKIVLDQNDVWWRKNIRDNNGNETFDTEDYYGYGADGVDPNRNYGFHYGDVATSDNQLSLLYNGEEAFSELETQAIRDFLMSRNILAGVSYHSYSELVLFPYGHLDGAIAPDNDELEALAVLMASQIPKLGTGTYHPSSAWDLYPAMGGTDDWAYGTQGIFNYTIELGTEFIPDADGVNTIKNDNLEAARSLLKRNEYRTITGLITDANSGDAIEAIIDIPEIDNTGYYREPYRSESIFGRYYRFLPEGQHDVVYKAFGYESQTITVTISEDSATIQNVQLIPENFVNVNGLITDQNLNPIADAEISLRYFTDIDPVVSDLNGNFILDNISEGNLEFSVKAPGYPEHFLTYDVSENSELNIILYTGIVYEDFETDLSNWTSTGFWGITADEAFSGEKSLKSNNGFPAYNSEISSNEIYIENYGNPHLVFDLKTTYAADHYFYIDIESDGVLKTIYAYSRDRDWFTVDVDLTEWKDRMIKIKFSETQSQYNPDEQGSAYIDNIKIYQYQESTGINNINTVKNELLVSQNYPNPYIINNSRSVTSIKYYNPTKADVEFSIFNIKGQKVYNEKMLDVAKGNHTISWNGNDGEVGSGVYFYKIKSGKYSSTKKMIILK